MSQVTPSLTILLWLSLPCHCQYDPYGGPPYSGEPDPFAPFFTPPVAPLPQAPRQNNPIATSSNNVNQFNPFLPTGINQNQQLSQQQQQLLQQEFQKLYQQQLQQLQGSYPNLPTVPFQTVSPNNQQQRIDKYPFPLGNNLNSQQANVQQQQQSFGSPLLTPQYPNFPDRPFQTIQPGQIQSNLINNQQNPYRPRTELPRIRVIEFPSSEYFEYGGGKLVQPKRPNSDLYVGGSGGDVPITSKIFVECTGPNQVEWTFNGTSQVIHPKVIVTW